MDSSIAEQFMPLWSDLKEEDEFYIKKPLLAHYSSIEVLEKISRTDELWLSNPLFMNDFEEVRFGINESYGLVLEDKQVNQSCGGAQRYEVFRDAYSHYYSEFAEKHALDTYVLCLSEHDPENDDGALSMWRGYGGNGHGAAIVFDASKLNNLPTSVFILAKVHYGSREDRIAWIGNKITQFCSILSGATFLTSDLPAVAFQLFQRFKLFALFSKHRGFAEEAEWRVVYMRDRDGESRLASMFDYRIGPSGVEPTLKFKIGSITGTTVPDFSLDKIVNRIILGPTVSSPLACAAVKKMLERAGHPELAKSVRTSSIPYRGVRV